MTHVSLLSKKDTLLLLVFHFVFLAHFEKQEIFKELTSHSLSSQNNQYYHHVQTPPFEASLSK